MRLREEARFIRVLKWYISRWMMWNWLKPPAKPGRIRITRSRTEMNNVYKVNFPVPSDTDPSRVSWSLVVTLDGVAQPTLTGPIADASTEIRVPLLPGGGTPAVELSLTHVDLAGNVSPARVVTFQEADTIPPAQPGEFSVELVGQEG